MADHTFYVYNVSMNAPKGFFEDHERDGYRFVPVKSPWGADLFQFWGGSDVSPSLYGEKNTHSMCDERRDLYEAGFFSLGQRLNIPMVGICRGGQFLNVMCGGKMIQEVPGRIHCRPHDIIVDKEPANHKNKGFKEIYATSTHHQMMVPGEEACIIGHAKEHSECDPEVVYYWQNKCLCFQPHPEYSGFEELTDYYFELLISLVRGLL